MMRRLLVEALLAVTIVCGGAVAARAAAPGTLRIDLFPTGTATEEHFSLARIVREPN